MPTYEEMTAAAVVDAIADADVSQATLDAINEILGTVPATETGVLADGLDAITADTLVAVIPATEQLGANNVAQVAQAAAVIMQNAPNAPAAILNFDADAATTTMVLNDASGHNISFATADDVTVQLGAGQNVQVKTSTGNDQITFAGAGENATIDTGAEAVINTGTGSDTVLIQGIGKATVISEGDELSVNLATDINNIQVTVSGSDGFDRVNSNDSVDAFDFAVVDGQVVMTDAEAPATRAPGEGSVTMENVDLLLFNGAGQNLNEWMDGGQATVIASSEAESLVAKLYMIGLGRGESGVLDKDNLGSPVDGGQGGYQTTSGINFWTDYVNSNPDESLQSITYKMLNGAEFKAKHEDQTAAEYVESLYQILGLETNEVVTNEEGRTTTFDEYVQHIQNSGDQLIGKMDVALDMATSDTAVEVLGADGGKFVIETFTDDAAN